MSATESGTKRKREDEEVEKKQNSVVEEKTEEEKEEKKEDVQEEDEESGSEYEDESDSDVEFVLAPNKGAAASNVEQASAAPTQSTTQTQTAEASAQGQTPSQPAQGTLDIDAEGTYNDQPISQVPITSFQDKPWRRPGVDLSDYFNYGFDEMSWIAYCNRQDKLRAQASMPGMMGDMGQASMVPPMPMMPMGQMPMGQMPMGQMPNPPMGMPPFMMPPQMMFPPEQH